MATVSYYGAVKLLRDRCRFCKRWALVIDGEMACCGSPPGDVYGTQRMTTGRIRRPSKRVTSKMLDRQAGLCMYCGQEFGEYREVRLVLRRLRPCWDHFMPRSYSFDDRAENGVVCCNVCNGWKSNLMFETAGEVREFVARRWAREGIDVAGVRALPEAVRADASVAAILLAEVQAAIVERKSSAGLIRSPRRSWRNNRGPR
jgi:hypothetical protein